MTSGLNYSKWDNLDSDSDSEQDEEPSNAYSIPTPKPPSYSASKPSASTSQSPSSAAVTWTEDLPAIEGRVQAIRVPCPADQQSRPASWFPVSIPFDHPIFRASLSPVSVLVEFPVRIWREGTKNSVRAMLDNQTATWMMIDSK